jgi:hypothetical protein
MSRSLAAKVRKLDSLYADCHDAKELKEHAKWYAKLANFARRNGDAKLAAEFREKADFWSAKLAA